MNTPAEQREKKIKAAERARSLIDGLGKTNDLDARATMLHDRVSEGIKTICTQNQGFNQKQTEVLTEIAVHLALLFDSDLKTPTGFWRRLRVEVSQMGPAAKIGFAGVAIALVVGAAQIANVGWASVAFFLGSTNAAEEELKPSLQTEAVITPPVATNPSTSASEDESESR